MFELAILLFIHCYTIKAAPWKKLQLKPKLKNDKIKHS